MRDADGGDTKYSMSVRRASNADFMDKRKWIECLPESAAVRASLDYQVDLDDSSLAELHEEVPSAQPVGCTVRHFLPQRLSIGLDLSTENARAIVATVAGERPHGGLRSWGAFRTALNDREILVPNRAVQFILSTLEKLSGVEQARSFRAQCYPPTHVDASGVALTFLLDQLQTLPRRGIELRSALATSPEFGDLVADSIRAVESEHEAVLPYRLPAAIAGGWQVSRRLLREVRSIPRTAS